MTETKENPAAELARLRTENQSLRNQLAAAGGRVVQPEHTFQLSEGARQELLVNGVTNVDGVLRTRDEVKKLLPAQQKDVDLGDADPPAGMVPAQPRSAIRGFDFVYPSVEPGYIDPAVAGLPGINGPSADSKPKDA